MSPADLGTPMPVLVTQEKPHTHRAGSCGPSALLHTLNRGVWENPRRLSPRPVASWPKWQGDG